jgi:hypothetical protein
VVQTNTYDSDFSVASSPPASATSDDYSEPENPEIAALIPPGFWNPPQPPGLDFKWHCPASKCRYTINMLDLSSENTKGLDSATNAFLRVKKWRKITEPRVMRGFYTMVSDHYNDHMAKENVTWQNYCQTNVSVLVLSFPFEFRFVLSYISGKIGLEEPQETPAMAATKAEKSVGERCRDYEARGGRGSAVNRDCIRVAYSNIASTLSSQLIHLRQYTMLYI